jgi:hypothetical protein
VHPAPGRLCRHAVALVLYAVDRRLPWHAVSADNSRRAPGQALDALTAPEKAAVLDRLLAARPTEAPAVPPEEVAADLSKVKSLIELAEKAIPNMPRY